MSRPSLRSLAAELSTYWLELGSILASRRLQASLHPELGSKLTPSKLRALDLLAEHGGLRIGELADRVGVDDTTATRMSLSNHSEPRGVGRLSAMLLRRSMRRTNAKDLSRLKTVLESRP